MFDPAVTDIDLGSEPGSEPGAERGLLRPDLGRFKDLGLLGRGGVGEVRRVHDPELGRVVALKVLRAALRHDAEARESFLEEARVAARLRHPAVIAIYECGALPDGRPYFTMEEVRGRTLRELIEEAHAGAGGLTRADLRRLVVLLQRASLAVASAHHAGVLHRDLKPSNIMVCAEDGVRVLDWGLARGYAGASPSDADPAGDEAEPGVVAGTPPYMPPEQARGARGEQGPWTDVYALGAVLFQVLTGHPPLRVGSLREAADRLGAGWREPMTARHEIPSDLREICEVALASEPARRHPDADALASALARWVALDERRERALGLVSEADRLLPELSRARARAASLRSGAARQRASLPPLAPAPARRDLWAREREAERLEIGADRLERDATLLLERALATEPGCAPARSRLAELCRARVRAAEARGEEEPLYEALLERYDRHAGARGGDAWLSLETEPSGALVLLHRYELVDQRLEPQPARSLGPTPIREVPLERGAYLLLVRAPGYEELRYPVCLRRGERWDGVPQGALSPLPVPLAPRGALGPLDRYVPAGLAWTGGDGAALDPLPRRRRWMGGFVIQALPLLQADGAPAWLSFAEALARAAARAAETGLPWRLPTELEWEKAARGADGRLFPWGSAFEPCFAATRAARLEGPPPVEAFPLDLSPYGVLGLAGNAPEWCLDQDGQPVLRGGAWDGPPAAARAASRAPVYSAAARGALRLARSWP